MDASEAVEKLKEQASKAMEKAEEQRDIDIRKAAVQAAGSCWAGHGHGTDEKVLATAKQFERYIREGQ